MVAPAVSILIPVYNREAYIEECVRSALEQTFNDIEIVLVDNASTDRTWEICRELSTRDERLRIFRNERNLGPVRNWRRCVEEARGQFCKILFSDDLLMPDCVERLVAAIDRNVGMAVCSALIGSSPEEATPDYFQNMGSERSIIYPSSDFYVRMLLFGDAPISPGAILVRREDLLKNIQTGFPTQVKKDFARHGAGPDLMVSLLTARSYSRVAIVKQPLVFFRVHEGSFTIENRNNEIKTSYEVVWNYYLKNYERKLFWCGRVFNSWLKKLWKQKMSLSSCFLQSEGAGTLGEAICGFFGLFLYILEKKIYRAKRKSI